MYQKLNERIKNLTNKKFFWYFSVLTLTTEEQRTRKFFLYFWVTLKN